MSDNQQNSFAEMQARRIRDRQNPFDENKRFNNEIISSKKTDSPFSPNTTPAQVGQSSTQQAVAISNASVKSTASKRASKAAIASSMRAQATSARKENTPAIRQANLQQPSLFNLGF